MQHLDEGTIHAWLDSALSAEEAARAEAHVASCPACADAVAEARGLIAASSRILTALDDVPNIRSARGARGAKGAGDARRFLTTWLVRERIAAVMALVVAGGALAVVLTRPTQQAAQVDLAAEPIRTFEVAAADSPAPALVTVPNVRVDAPQGRGTGDGAVPTSPPARTRDLATTRQAEGPPPPSLVQQTAPTVAMDASASVARTDDSLRPVSVAEARREEAAEQSVEGKASVAQKVAGAVGRRRAAETQTAFTEPRPVASVGSAAGAAAPSQAPRLVQDVTMTESGREVRRRIYMVENVLVTLDERPAIVGAVEMRQPSANAPRPDSSAGGTTMIQWTGAKGTEFTLTGPAPRETLERIRKALGF